MKKSLIISTLAVLAFLCGAMDVATFNKGTESKDWQNDFPLADKGTFEVAEGVQKLTITAPRQCVRYKCPIEGLAAAAHSLEGQSGRGERLFRRGEFRRAHQGPDRGFGRVHRHDLFAEFGLRGVQSDPGPQNDGAALPRRAHFDPGVPQSSTETSYRTICQINPHPERIAS